MKRYIRTVSAEFSGLNIQKSAKPILKNSVNHFLLNLHPIPQNEKQMFVDIGLSTSILNKQKNLICTFQMSTKFHVEFDDLDLLKNSRSEPVINICSELLQCVSAEGNAFYSINKTGTEFEDYEPVPLFGFEEIKKIVTLHLLGMGR